MLFHADDDVSGDELWITDGTPEGTELLIDINPGADSSFLKRDVFFKLGDQILFYADNGTDGYELWSSDGTAGGTSLLKDINTGPDGSLSAGSFITFFLKGDQAIFSADDGVNGRELWITDGTTAGTTLLKDINPGADGSSRSEFFQFGDQILFFASDGTHGKELWITDGTQGGTQLLKDINSLDTTSTNVSSFVSFYQLGTNVVFSADDGVHGQELWVTDGTTDGTKILKDINPGNNDSDLLNRESIQLGDLLLFSADDGVHGRELWVTDGTTDGTRLLKEIDTVNSGGSSSPKDFIQLGNMVLFYANDVTHGRELWVSDGTTDGTTMLIDLQPGPLGSSGSGGRSFVQIGDKVIINADVDAVGNELWVTDGTAAGTTLLKDINPGETSSTPNGLYKFGNSALFAARDGVNGEELWITDGTSAGTMMVKDIDNVPGNSNPWSFFAADLSLGTTSLPTVSIGLDQSASEPNGILAFDVMLSAVASTDITVNYSMHTATDSATFDTDYALIVGQGNGGVAASGYTGTVVIPAGQTTAQVSFSILDDILVEGSETFTLELLPDTNDSPTYKVTNTMEDAIATGTILDNDASSGIAPVALDFTIGGLVPDDIIATIFASDIVSEFGSDMDSNLDAFSLSFGPVTVNGTGTATLADIGFSYMPGIGDAGGFTINTNSAPLIDALADGATLDIDVSFTISDGVLSDMGSLFFTATGTTGLFNLDLGYLGANVIGQTLDVEASAGANEANAVIEFTGPNTLRDIAADINISDPITDFIDSFQGNSLTGAYAFAQDDATALSTVNTVVESFTGVKGAIASAFQDGTATATADNTSLAIAGSANMSEAVANASDNSEAMASAASMSTAVATASDNGSLATAVADGSSVASASAEGTSDAQALAENGSVADAIASLVGSSTAVADDLSNTSATSSDSSTAVASAEDSASASASAIEESVASADATNDSIANAVSIISSAATASASSTSDALAFAEDRSAAEASASQESSASATAQEISNATASASDGSTSTASADQVASATAFSIENAVANAEGIDGAIATAVAKTEAAASATARAASDALAFAEDRSAADATSKQGSSASATAEQSSVATATADDQSTSTAVTVQTSSATAFSSETSVASAEGSDSSIANAVAITDSSASATAMTTSDALAFGNAGSAAEATSITSSSASAVADANSAASANAVKSSTAVALGAEGANVAASIEDGSVGGAFGLNGATATSNVNTQSTLPLTARDSTPAGTSRARSIADDGSDQEPIANDITGEITVAKAQLADAAMNAITAVLDSTSPASLTPLVEDHLDASMIADEITARGTDSAATEGTPAALPVDITPTDPGSTITSVTLSGLPEGSVLSAGAPNATGTVWTFSGLPPADLTFTAPAGSAGSYNLIVTVEEAQDQNPVALIATVIQTVDIAPDDTPLPTFSIAPLDATKGEGDSGLTAFTFEVTRTGDSSVDAEVEYSVSPTGDKPVDGFDFDGDMGPTGTLFFDAGVDTQTITVNVTGDADVENDESFSVDLSSATNATIGTSSAIGIIENDDVAATPSVSIADAKVLEGDDGTTILRFTVSKTFASEGGSTVAFETSDATATAGGDYVARTGFVSFGDTDTEAFIDIIVNGDMEIEPDEIFSITISQALNSTGPLEITRATATGTILNDDSEPENTPPARQ